MDLQVEKKYISEVSKFYHAEEDRDIHVVKSCLNSITFAKIGSL